jgi:hypothetical protein
MTRGEAQVARALDAYSDLDNRIRAARAVAFALLVGGAVIGMGAVAALGAGAPLAAGAAVWGPAGLALIAGGIVGRGRLAWLKARRRERDAERRLTTLRGQARRMRIASAFVAELAGAVAVADAVEAQQPGNAERATGKTNDHRRAA